MESGSLVLPSNQATRRAPDKQRPRPRSAVNQAKRETSCLPKGRIDPERTIANRTFHVGESGRLPGSGRRCCSGCAICSRNRVTPMMRKQFQGQSVRRGAFCSGLADSSLTAGYHAARYVARRGDERS